MQVSSQRRRRCASSIAFAFVLLLTFSLPVFAATRTRSNSDITGTVSDSASGQPLASAEVSVMRGVEIVFNASTDAFGRYTAHNISPGTYTVAARFLGFRPESKTVVVAEASGDIRLDFAMTPVAINLSEVTVTASAPLAVDTRTG